MDAHRKKIVVVLMIVLVGGATALCFVRSEDSAARAQYLPRQAGLLSGNEPNLPGADKENASTRELFVKMMISVLLVGVLGAGAVYVSRRFLPKLSGLAGRRIQVIETVHIGPRKALHLVKVDDQCLLIGSTNEQITRLADVSGCEVELPGQYAEDTGGRR